MERSVLEILQMTEFTALRYLEIDLGNTCCKWRLREVRTASLQGHKKEQIISRGSALTTTLSAPESLVERGHDTPAKTISAAILEMFTQILASDISQVSICSVASKALNTQLQCAIENLWGLQAVFFEVQAECAGLINSYIDPQKMGADRWLASIAANHLYPNVELCVVDCGTAINIEYLSAQSVHCGGYIVPGLQLMQSALLASTAQINSAAGHGRLEKGLDTAANVQNGSLYLVIALLEKLQREMADIDGLLIVTGGSSALLEPYFKQPNLVFSSELVLQGFKFL